MLAGLLKAPSRWRRPTTSTAARAAGRRGAGRDAGAEGYITAAAGDGGAGQAGQAGARTERGRRLVRRLGAGRADRPSRQARARPRRAHHARPRLQAAAERRATSVLLAEAVVRDRVEAGGGGGAGHQRRGARHGRRPRPRDQPVQPRRQRPPPARLGVQAVRLPGGARGRLAAGQHDRRPARCASKDWQPANFDGKFRGPITLDEAFAHSVNTAAVRLAPDRRARAGWRRPRASWASSRPCSRCPRSRSAPRR